MKYKMINTNDIFGKWLVLDENDYEDKGKYKKYKCQCQCINKTIKYVDERNLKNGASTCCGKCARKRIVQGDKFHSWTVLLDETNSKYVSCICECGTIKNVDKQNLLCGISTNCGCKQRDNRFAVNQYSNSGDKIVINNVYSKWKVLSKVKTDSYLCECSCFYHTQRILRRSELLSSKKHNGCKKCRLIKYHTNETFGYLTIRQIDIEQTKLHNGRIYVHADCKCGNHIIAEQNTIIRGRIISCGCKKHEYNNEETLIGKRFGHLLVTNFLGRHHTSDNNSVLLFECLCDCGKTTVVRKSNLIHRGTWSCGCMKRSHGEELIYRYLKKYHFEFEEQYRISDCKNKLPLPFDFALFDGLELLGLIEFDGIQHFVQQQFNGCSKEDAYEKFNDICLRDDIKTFYCKSHNIPLLRITYEDLENDELYYKLWDFLLSLHLIESLT